MRLSEAIRLGSLAIEDPVALDTRFCAIGMACEAIGKRHMRGSLFHGVDHYNYLELEKAWPWVGEDYAGEQIYGLNKFDDYEAAIFSFFDDGVATGEMTLEALCDEVAGWERDCEAKGVNVEQVSIAAAPETTREPAAEHTQELELKSASR